MKIHERDMKILVELRKNARAQLTEISKATQIPISTIFERIRTKSGGIITKHVSLMQFDKIGFGTKATIFLKCGKNSKQHVYDELKSHHNTNSLYKVNNGFDYMVEMIFRNFCDLENFLEIIEEKHTIKNKQVYYIIDEIVKEGFLSNPFYTEII